MDKDEMKCDDGVCEMPNQESKDSRAEPNGGDRLIYVGDPMCSWCWGITNHLEKIKSEYANQLDFQLVLGGLRPGGGDEWNEDFRNMIRSHWEHVQTASGQPFDFRFFERTQFNYDTEPSARAVRVVRDIAPDKEWSFYKRLQSAFYAENKDVHDLTTYEAICEDLNIDYASFESKFLTQEYKRLTIKDYEFAKQLGIRGFPAVVIKKGEEYSAVTMGYSDYEKMKGVIERVLS